MYQQQYSNCIPVFTVYWLYIVSGLYIHRLNMELDLQSFFGLHEHSCTHWLRSRTPPPSLGSYTRVLLVSQDRRHLFMTSCVHLSKLRFGLFHLQYVTFIWTLRYVLIIQTLSKKRVLLATVTSLLHGNVQLLGRQLTSQQAFTTVLFSKLVLKFN